MVECNDTDQLSFGKVGEPLELHHFYLWNDYTEADPECDEDKATENADIVEGELESLASILTEHEYSKVEDLDSILAQSAKNSLIDVLHVMDLSIVPNFEDGKLFAKDKEKNRTLALRKFPAVELSIALVKAYPSHRAPLLALKGPFYQRFKQTILAKLHEVWAEEAPAIYEMVCIIQDDLIPALLEEYESELVRDAEGNFTVEFETTEETQIVYEQAQAAY